MIIWKTINDTEGNKFPFSHPEDEAQSPIRKRHFANSRMALMECLVELAPESHQKEASPLCLKDLAIKNHHQLENYPQLLVSLAHTRGLAAACLAEKMDDVLAVGIDCEHSERAFRSEILTKFAHENDKAISPLHLWCAKEAAFKAASYFWKEEKTFVLKDITIEGKTFVVPNLLQGTLSFELKDDYLVALAVVTKLLS